MHFTQELIQSNKYIAKSVEEDKQKLDSLVLYAYRLEEKIKDTNPTMWRNILESLEETLKTI